MLLLVAAAAAAINRLPSMEEPANVTAVVLRKLLLELYMVLVCLVKKILQMYLPYNRSIYEAIVL